MYDISMTSEESGVDCPPNNHRCSKLNERSDNDDYSLLSESSHHRKKIGNVDITLFGGGGSILPTNNNNTTTNNSFRSNNNRTSNCHPAKEKKAMGFLLNDDVESRRSLHSSPTCGSDDDSLSSSVKQQQDQKRSTRSLRSIRDKSEKDSGGNTVDTEEEYSHDGNYSSPMKHDGRCSRTVTSNKSLDMSHSSHNSRQMYKTFETNTVPDIVRASKLGFVPQQSRTRMARRNSLFTSTASTDRPVNETLTDGTSAHSRDDTYDSTGSSFTDQNSLEGTTSTTTTSRRTNEYVSPRTKIRHATRTNSEISHLDRTTRNSKSLSGIGLRKQSEGLDDDDDENSSMLNATFSDVQQPKTQQESITTTVNYKIPKQSNRNTVSSGKLKEKMMQFERPNSDNSNSIYKTPSKAPPSNRLCGIGLSSMPESIGTDKSRNSIQERISSLSMRNLPKSNSNRSLNSGIQNVPPPTGATSPSRRERNNNPLNHAPILSNSPTKTNREHSLNCSMHHVPTITNSPTRHERSSLHQIKRGKSHSVLPKQTNLNSHRSLNNSGYNQHGELPKEEDNNLEPIILTKTIITTTTTTTTVKKKKKKDGTVISEDVVNTDVSEDKEVVIETSRKSGAEGPAVTLSPKSPPRHKSLVSVSRPFPNRKDTEQCNGLSPKKEVTETDIERRSPTARKSSRTLSPSSPKKRDALHSTTRSFRSFTKKDTEQCDGPIHSKEVNESDNPIRSLGARKCSNAILLSKGTSDVHNCASIDNTTPKSVAPAPSPSKIMNKKGSEERVNDSVCSPLNIITHKETDTKNVCKNPLTSTEERQGLAISKKAQSFKIPVVSDPSTSTEERQGLMKSKISQSFKIPVVSDPLTSTEEKQGLTKSKNSQYFKTKLKKTFPFVQNHNQNESNKSDSKLEIEDNKQDAVMKINVRVGAQNKPEESVSDVHTETEDDRYASSGKKERSTTMDNIKTMKVNFSGIQSRLRIFNKKPDTEPYYPDNCSEELSLGGNSESSEFRKQGSISTPKKSLTEKIDKEEDKKCTRSWLKSKKESLNRPDVIKQSEVTSDDLKAVNGSVSAKKSNKSSYQSSLINGNRVAIHSPVTGEKSPDIKSSESTDPSLVTYNNSLQKDHHDKKIAFHTIMEERDASVADFDGDNSSNDAVYPSMFTQRHTRKNTESTTGRERFTVCQKSKTYLYDNDENVWCNDDKIDTAVNTDQHSAVKTSHKDSWSEIALTTESVDDGPITTSERRRSRLTFRELGLHDETNNVDAWVNPSRTESREKCARSSSSIDMKSSHSLDTISSDSVDTNKNSSFMSRSMEARSDRSLSVSVHSFSDIERSAEHCKKNKKRRGKKDKNKLKKDHESATSEDLSGKKTSNHKEKKTICIPAVNDLKLHKILGEGSFGQVWLATFEDIKIDSTDQEIKRKERTYALKILSKFNLIQNGEVPALHNEINVLKVVRNQHPCIMNLVAVTQDENLIYLMQDFAQGGELFSLLQKYRDSETGIGGLPEYHACFYSACIADALCFLHVKHHLVFRDLKPENVMLNKHGYPVIIDFGYAKFLSEEEPKTYTLVGTPRYMSPELILSLGYDYGTDNWSLGALIYELLSGYNPFEGPLPDDEDGLDEMELFESIVKENYVPLPESAKLSPEAGAIVSALLTKEPAERLGFTGSPEILDHDWFLKFDIDFHSLRRRKLDSPWVPDIEGILDCRHFDNWDHLASNPDTCIIKNNYPKLTDREAAKFIGFET